MSIMSTLFRTAFGELDNKFTQNDLIVKFGKPEAYSDNWIRYSINNKYVHFEFNELKELLK